MPFFALLAIVGLGIAIGFGREARARDVGRRGPKPLAPDQHPFTSELAQKANRVTGKSGNTYFVTLVEVSGDVQIFDVWTAPAAGTPSWLLRYSHNTASRNRVLLSTARRTASMIPLIDAARSDFI